MSAKEGTTIVDLDAAINALYQAPLDGFTAERNALAAALRKSGDKVNADRVKALPKPGVTAWAVNQAWWRDEAAFRAMLDAGEAQRSAHVAHARGTPSDVRAAAEARQQAVAVVIESAVASLGGPGEVAPDVRHRIAGTVEALASSGVPRDATLGRLVKELQSSGLEALGALAGLAPSAFAPKPSAPSAPPPRPVIVSRSSGKSGVSEHEARQAAKAEAAARERAEKRADAKARLAERETALKAATAEATESARAEKKARAAVEAGAARIAELEEKLEEAREEERAARRRLAHAMKVASEAEMMRARTARDVNVAREQVDALREGA